MKPSESTPRIAGLYVNLPVTDLPRSISFYEALGFSRNPQFSDQTAACVVLGEGLCLMLLSHPKFAEFSPLPIADARASTQVLVALQLDSREAVDRLFEAAVAHGGQAFRPTEDHGFMITRAFSDPDGHAFEPFWMNPEGMPAQQGE
jgi:predicted lactoylglutathione lyase